MRRNVPALAAAGCAILIAACAGSEAVDAPVVTIADAVAAPAETLAAERDPVEVAVEQAPTPPIRVDMTVELESISLDTEVGSEVDPAALESTDPFDTFASCSGGHRAFGPYSVLVSSPGGEVVAASVVTVGLVAAPGIHGADVRIELGSGDVESAAGTVTIAPGWRSGTFVAFGADGGAVNGSFECTGGDPSPAPLDTSDMVGRLDSVEVVALLHRDVAERVVGLAVETARSPEVAAECPAAGGAAGDSSLLVRVDGDQTIGAISMFELTDGGAPTLRLSVGGASYVFDDVVTTITEHAGTFSATADGLTVDGAFRCT